MQSTARLSGMVLIGVILSACSKPKGSEYFPEASLGGRYEYSVEYRSLLSVEHASMVTRADEQTTIQGKRYYKMVSTFIGIPGLDQQISYSRSTPEGVYLIDGDSMDKPEYLDTPLPVSVGSSWTSVGPSSRTTYHALDFESVETGSEAFKNCLKVSFKTDGKTGASEGTEYLAPNIGMVRMSLTANGTPMTLTLVKYKK